MPGFRTGSATDVGRVRVNNQDSRLTTSRVFAVADGMGGHRGGEVASVIALETLNGSFVDGSVEGLVEATEDANAAILRRAEEDTELQGMGTTLVAIAPLDDRETLAWVNVGDSRLYRLRGGELEQISEDHSLVEEAVRNGQLSPEEARIHPQRNILTRALGIESAVEVDSGTIDLVVGDRYLLCSDGLFNEVDEGRIAATLRRLDDPRESAQELVRLANESGGRDNITVVVVDVVADDDATVSLADEVGPGTAESSTDLAGFTSPPAEAVDDLTTTIVGRTADSAPAAPPAPAREERAHAKHRRFTWRVAAFLVVFLVLVAGVMGAIVWQARYQYYVGLDIDPRGQEVVTAFKGTPGGLLWFDPTVEKHYPIGLDAMPVSEHDEIRSGHEVGSLSAADAYVANQQELNERQRGTPTTTTTTLPPTTTSAVPPAPAPVPQQEG